MKTKTACISMLILLYTISGNSQSKNNACNTPEHRQFDFWLGEWSVYDPQGNYVGSNTIKLLQDDCVLQENWVGAKGFTGSSYNHYDTKTAKWHQLWLDNQGGKLDLNGNFINGSMVLQSEEKYSKKNDVYFIDRISLTPKSDGTVRQHWERSTDKGNSWNTVFDGLYKKQ